MNSYFIPNTKVAADVLEPKHPGGFVSLFLAAGETLNNKNVGSVNAGTSYDGSVFAVGLGGINGAFASSLHNAGQNTDLYENIHQNLFDSAQNGLSTYKADFQATDPVQFSIMMKPHPSYQLPHYDGVVFIDVFNANQIPNKNELNYSMIYVTPPNSTNYKDDASFLAAIEATSTTIIQVLDLYNTQHATDGNKSGLKPINNIRMCLFSGQIYRGNTPAEDVAKHNIMGLSKGLNLSDNQIELIQFEFDSAKNYLTKGD